MNKAEAIQAMKEGKKVTHRHFSDDEWVTIQGEEFLFEDGVICGPTQFWGYRTDASWETDWELFNEPNKKTKHV